MIDVYNIINDSKKSFTRERASVINNFLKSHAGAVILSFNNKERGASVNFYYLKNDKKVKSDYVLKNAKIVIDALKSGGASLYYYNGQSVKEYTTIEDLTGAKKGG